MHWALWPSLPFHQQLSRVSKSPVFPRLDHPLLRLPYRSLDRSAKAHRRIRDEWMVHQPQLDDYWRIAILDHHLDTNPVLPALLTVRQPLQKASEYVLHEWIAYCRKHRRVIWANAYVPEFIVAKKRHADGVTEQSRYSQALWGRGHRRRKQAFLHEWKPGWHWKKREWSQQSQRQRQHEKQIKSTINRRFKPFVERR